VSRTSYFLKHVQSLYVNVGTWRTSHTSKLLAIRTALRQHKVKDDVMMHSIIFEYDEDGVCRATVSYEDA